MRALLCKRLGPPDLLAIENIASPDPHPKEIVIRVKAAGLNFFDTLIISGKYQYRPEVPFSPGAELSGTVVKLGRDVQGFSLGDRVMAFTGWGALREEVAVKAAKVIALPDDVGHEAAAVMQVTYGTALHALHDRALLRAGETLVVLGAAGGTGQAAIELGKFLGAVVIAIAASDEKLDFCRSVGADQVINGTRENVKERIKELTHGRGADVIFDPVGGDLSEAAFRSIAWGGRHLVIGFASGEIPRLALNLPLLKGASITGVFWGEHVERDPKRHRANMERLINWFRNKRISPHIDHSCRLEDAHLALMAIVKREIKGKAIVVIS
jgi:NADPH2:quinone reductase